MLMYKQALVNINGDNLWDMKQQNRIKLLTILNMESQENKK